MSRAIETADLKQTDGMPSARELEALVRAAAPRSVKLLGISTGPAGPLLVTAGENIDRLLARAPKQRSAAPAQYPPPPARPPATASTSAAMAKPTARLT